MNQKKKTVFMWVLIVLEILNIPFLLLATFSSEGYTGSEGLRIVGQILNIVSLIIVLVWLHRAFFLKKDLVKWTHLNFGFGLLIEFFAIVGIYLNTGNLIGAISVNAFMIIVTVVVWILFVKHLSKAIQTNKIQLQ